MNIDALIAHYGLAVIAIGAAVEGEPFAIAAGLMAHDRIVSLPAAMLTSIGGAIAIDQGWYLIARRFRDHRWIRGIRDRPAFETALGWLEKHPVPFVSLFRFAYGLRAVAPVAIGTAGIRPRLYVPLTLLSAIVWGAGFTLIGYGFGNTLDRWIAGRPLVRYALYAIPFAAFILTPILTLRRRRGKGSTGGGSTGGLRRSSPKRGPSS